MVKKWGFIPANQIYSLNFMIFSNLVLDYQSTILELKTGRLHGPLRAYAHIRIFARFDYQLDTCNDSIFGKRKL